MAIKTENCQVFYIDEIAEKDPFPLQFENFKKEILRKISFYKIFSKVRNYKRMKYLKSHEAELMKSTENKNTAEGKLQPGDRVLVRPKTEILETLDKRNRTKGCAFMNEMWQYVGTEQRVLKRVEYFFDECKAVMKKTNKIVLLDGLQCQGELGYSERCDRNCYFFWREEWLKKID